MPRAVSLSIDHVLDAALYTFDSDGYSATRVPAIATRAGAAVGSLYRFFPSKEAIANALYQREKWRLATALFSELDTEASAEHTFAVIWDRLGEFAAEHPESLCFLELHHHDAYLDDSSRALAAALDERVADMIRTWQAQGAVRAGDPALLHLQVFGGFVAVVRQLRRRDGTVTRDVAHLTREPAWALLRRT